jgi:hypothetical protein
MASIMNSSQTVSLNEDSEILQPTTAEHASNSNLNAPLKKNKKSCKKPNCGGDGNTIPIELYPYQKTHKKKLETILDKSPFAFDFSMLGTGKTYTTCSFMTDEGTPFKNLICITPVSVKAKWKTMERDYGVRIQSSVSYCELRSVKFKQPKHGLLIRRDFMEQFKHADETTGERESVEYKCSQEYLDLVNEGLLLVIDEIQNIKNISNQLEACKELMRPIIEGFFKERYLKPIEEQITKIEKQIADFKDQTCNSCVNKKEQLVKLNEQRTLLMSNTGKSRILLLSGSPIDKKQQVIHLFRALQIMKSDRLTAFNPQTWSIIWKGMAEIQQYFIDNWGGDAVYEVCYSFPFGEPHDTETEEYSYRLFQRVMKKNISSAMLPPKQKTQLIKRNAFYSLAIEHDVELLKKGVHQLGTSTQFNQDLNTVNFGTDGIESLMGIIRALTMIETAKISLFVRIAASALDENPNQKVVICVNYTETINDLMELMVDYNPLRMDGGLSAKQRGKVIEAFQKPTREHRLLIGNLSVCSTGIDLDDQDGNFPRLCLVSPNYSTITLYQLSHRFQRANTQSDAAIHFVFCKEAAELSILNALAKKSNVMKEITDQQVEYGVVFPGDYEIWQEPDSENEPLTEQQMAEIKSAVDVASQSQ